MRRTIRGVGVFSVIVLAGTLIWAIPVKAAGGGTGSTTFTNSIKTNTHITVLPTAFVRTDQFLTRVTAHLGAAPNLYDQTFSAPFADPSVQAAIAAATTALQGAGALATLGPNLLSTQTNLTGSATVNQDTVDHSTVTDIVTTYVGPQCIFVGDLDAPYLPCPSVVCPALPCIGTPYPIPAGVMDVDTRATTDLYVNRLPTQTDTYQTQAHYDLLGELSIEQVPVPALGAGGLAALGGLLVAAALIALRARS